MNTRNTKIGELGAKVGEEVTVFAWVDVRRDQGKLIFLDLRDSSGKVQSVALPSHEEMVKQADKVRPEWVLEVKGKVNKRPERNIKADALNGDIELEIFDIKILNEAETPAFDISGDGYEINEEVRLKYKFLDQRRARITRNISSRHKVFKYIRDFMDGRGFLEIETPILTNPTPEGARSFLVPSRVYPGEFYALPQSPQQYKQLLMIGGVDKYFQIAKCMRDEDGRGDRQPEFTQLDLEMSFVAREDVMKLNEELLINLVNKHFPEKKIQTIPFPVISYKESMEKYGNDRPDLREDKTDPNLLSFVWVVDFPFFEKASSGNNPEAEGEWTFTHNPFSKPIESHMNYLTDKTNIDEIITTQYDIVLNGLEIGGGSIRNHNPLALRKVFEIMGYSDERIENNFGHMLKALSAGAPPHGGIAWGLDRLMMILLDEPNIREVIAFPKTGEGRDLLMNAPSPTSEKQLKELKITVIKK